MSNSNPENLDPISDEPGAHPVGTGAGAAAGALFGAAMGAVAGPLGIAIGAIAGGVVGGLSGKELAEQDNPTVGVRPEEHELQPGVGGSIGGVIGGVIGLPAGPVGVIALASLGAAAGEWASQGVGHDVFPEEEDRRWRGLHGTLPYHSAGLTYEDYRPAYALGHTLRRSGDVFERSEDALQRSWERVKGASRLTWEEARHAVRDASRERSE